MPTTKRRCSTAKEPTRHHGTLDHWHAAMNLDEVERILIPPFPASNPGAPAKILSNKFQHLSVMLHRMRDVFMLYDLAKIYMYFQGSPFAVRDSVQHERNMKCDGPVLCSLCFTPGFRLI